MKKLSYLIILTLILGLVLTGCLPSKNQSPIITSTPGNLAEVGELYTYEVEATDPDGDTLTYSLDVKPSGMTIDSTTGLISWTPTAEGDYDVVVKVSDGALEITQIFTIEVSKAEEPGYVPTPTPPAPPAVRLTSIVVEPNTMTLFVGQTVTGELLDDYSITAYYSDGSTKDIDFDNEDCEYDFTSADEILDFSDPNNVTAVAEGTAIIVVSYTEGTITKTDEWEVTVIERELIRIEVEPSEVTLHTLSLTGCTQQLEVTAYYDDGNHGDVTPDCTYVSGDTSIASVDINGLILAKGFGKITITVSYTEGGITEEATVKVAVGRVHNITKDTYYNTIQAAINDANPNPGDTIEVMVGTYDEAVTIDKQLTLLGAQHGVDPTVAGARTEVSEESVIDAPGGQGIFINSNGTTVDGFTVKNSLERCIDVEGPDNTIINNIVSNAGSYGLRVDGSEKNTVANNRISESGDAGLFINRANNNIIENNLVFKNGLGPDNCGGIELDHSDGNLLIGNTVFGQYTGIGITGYYGPANNNTLTQNTILDNSGHGICIYGGENAGTIITHNTIEGNKKGISVYGSDLSNTEAHFNNIVGNTEYGIYNDTTSALDATGNWWGDASGPYHVTTNLDGLGDTVSDNVDFVHWVTSPFSY